MNAFCTYCSANKSNEPGEIPAIRRYQSPRIAKVYAAASELGVAFFILSGEFGLVPRHQPIPWYDHLLKPEEVDNLTELVAKQIHHFGITSIVYFTKSLTQEPAILPYHDVLVAACRRTSRPILVAELQTDFPIQGDDSMEKEMFTIPPIALEWSKWTAWGDLTIDARSGTGVRVPNRKPGVYESKYVYDEERLTIGKASDLRYRIKQGLVKGKAPHSAGDDIRASEDTSKIVVRWAVTDRPAAAEEELHKRHFATFGKLPKYTEHT